MSSRLVGAVLALTAAALLATSIATSALWSGHPTVAGINGGRPIDKKTVYVGVLGAKGCNTGGDGQCKSVELAGAFPTIGYAALGAQGLLLLLLLALGGMTFAKKDRRRTLAKLALIASIAAAAGVGALVAIGPSFKDGNVSVPLGFGMFLFAGSVVATIVASLLAPKDDPPPKLRPSRTPSQPRLPVPPPQPEFNVADFLAPDPPKRPSKPSYPPPPVAGMTPAGPGPFAPPLANGPMNPNGPMGPGGTNPNGPMGHGAMGPGGMNPNGPMGHGPMGPGGMNPNGPMGHGPMGPGGMNPNGPMGHGPMGPGGMNPNGPMGPGGMNPNGPMGHGAMGPGGMNPNGMHPGGMAPGGPMNPNGPMGHGAMGPGGMNPNVPMQMGPGQMGPGATNPRPLIGPPPPASPGGMLPGPAGPLGASSAPMFGEQPAFAPPPFPPPLPGMGGDPNARPKPASIPPPPRNKAPSVSPPLPSGPRTKQQSVAPPPFQIPNIPPFVAAGSAPGATSPPPSSGPALPGLPGLPPMPPKPVHDVPDEEHTQSTPLHGRSTTNNGLGVNEKTDMSATPLPDDDAGATMNNAARESESDLAETTARPKMDPEELEATNDIGKLAAAFKANDEAATEAVTTPRPPAASEAPAPRRASAPAIDEEALAKIPMTTASENLPPPKEEKAAPGPQPACPQCEAPMSWVEEHLRFYCKSCRMYF